MLKRLLLNETLKRSMKATEDLDFTGFTYGSRDLKAGTDLCITTGSNYGFLVIGSELAIYETGSSTAVSNAFGAGGGSYCISTSKDQTVKLLKVALSRTGDLFGMATIQPHIIVMKNNADTSMQFKVNETAMEEYMVTIFGSGEIKGKINVDNSVKIKSTSTSSSYSSIHSAGESDIYGVDYIQLEFNDAPMDGKSYSARINVEMDGTNLPNKVFKLEKGIYGPNTQELQTPSDPSEDGGLPKAPIIAIVVVVIVVVIAIIILILWCKFCYCKKRKQANAEEVSA